MSSYPFRGGGNSTNLPSLSTRNMTGGGINDDDNNNNEFEPLQQQQQSVGGSSSSLLFDLSYRNHPPPQETFEDEDENENFLRNIEDPLERDARDAIRERILFRKLMVSIPALTTVGVNVYAIIFTFFVVSSTSPASSPTSGILVLISGVIAALVSTVIFITEIFIVDDIQTLVEFDQHEVILLKTQQARLISKEKRLQLNVFCLKEDERRLICEMNDPHKGRKYLMGIVKKYKQQMISKTDAYRQYLVADVMNLIIRADKDESGDFDDSEIKHLIRYIKALPTVKVNEKKLSKAIKKERSLYSVLSLVQDLSSTNKKNIPAKKRIFTFDDKQVELQVIALSKKHEQQQTTLSSTSSNEGGRRKGGKPSTSTSSSRGRSKSPKSKNRNDDDDGGGGGSSKRRRSKKKSSKKGTTTRSERSLSPNSKLRSPTTDDSSSRIGELKHPIGSGGFGPSSGGRGRTLTSSTRSRSKSPTLSAGATKGRGMAKSRSLSPPSKDRSSGRSVSPLGLKNVKKGLSTFLSSTNRLKKDNNNNNNNNNSKGKKGGDGGGSKGDHLSSFF